MTGELDPLLDLHDDFEEALHAHQEALVRGDVTEALARAEALRDALRSHADDEERLLLPILENGGGWSRIGHPDYYRSDHRKIHALLDELCARTAALDPAAHSFHRDVARLLVGQHRLESVLQHHDDRERKALYPDVERLTKPEQRRRLRAAFRPGTLSTE